MKKPLIILTGPTAVGKTELSIQLAKAINGEIISADSVQVYKELNIGSAKIKEKEMMGIPHHLIDVLDLDENFNVAVFQRMAKDAIDEIISRNHLPIIVGGTAFYIQALLYGIDFTEEEHDYSYRNELLKIAETEKGKKEIYECLKETDPDYAETVHYNNAKRVVRALEYHHFTGNLFSKYNEEQKQKEALYDFHYIVLTDDREFLYQRINKRVDLMMQSGLLEEVKKIYDYKLPRDYTSMQGVGYRELFEYFDGLCDLDTAIENIKKNSRHFAKRQLTWFRKEQNVEWIDKREFDRDDQKILEYIIRLSKNIIEERF